MNEYFNPTSHARKGSVMAAALLTVLLATVPPGVMYAFLAARFFKGERAADVPNLPVTLDLTMTLFVAVTFCAGTVLAAPLWVLLARIAKPWHSAILVLCATGVSYVLLFTEVMSVLFRHLRFHSHSDLPYESIVAVAGVQFILIATLCLLYRLVLARQTARETAAAKVPEASPGTAPVGPGVSRFGTPAERRQLCWILAGIVALAGGGLFLYRENHLRRIPQSVWQALRQSREMTLFSLGGGDLEQPDSGFHGYDILGQTSVTTPGDRTAVHATIRHAVAFWCGAAMLCFSPRHGVRVSDGTNRYDFLICFECQAMIVFRNGKSFAGAPIRGPRAKLDAILRAANIPMEFPPNEEP